MFDTDIRNVGRFLSINGALHDVMEAKELLIAVQDIEYALIQYIDMYTEEIK